MLYIVKNIEGWVAPPCIYDDIGHWDKVIATFQDDIDYYDFELYVYKIKDRNICSLTDREIKYCYKKWLKSHK